MAPVSSDEAPRVRLDAVMATDVGVVRDHNEDAAHIDTRRSFFIVADGMGGHAAGEVASAMAVDTVRKTLEAARPVIDAFARKPSDPGRRELVQLLQNSVLAAHQAVFQRGSRESDKQGMGTTLDVVLVAGPEAFVAHVGDSRTYLIRDGRCAQITTDHTVAEVLVIEGKLSIEEAQVSPLRTILVNAIGVSADVGVEMAHLQLRPGDRLLLCSDGLHDYFVAEQEIADKLSIPEPNPALDDMIEMAKDRGGHDNITGILVNVLDVIARESVPGVIERDETMPVDVPPPQPAEWTDDEETQNLSPRELAGKFPDKRDIGTEVTLEAPAVRIDPPPAKPDGTKPDGTKPDGTKPDRTKAEATSEAKAGDGGADTGRSDLAVTKPDLAKPDFSKVDPSAPNAEADASNSDNRTTVPMRVIRAGTEPHGVPPKPGAEPADDESPDEPDPAQRDKT